MHTCTRPSTDTRARTRTCVYACMHAGTLAMPHHTYVCMCVCVICMCVYMRVMPYHTYACMRVYACVYACICMCVCVYTYAGHAA